MNAAAENVYNTIRKNGSQQMCLDTMQTRKRLYEVLDYHRYENKIDELIRKSQS
jgi:methylisocitrate lyase